MTKSSKETHPQGGVLKPKIQMQNLDPEIASGWQKKPVGSCWTLDWWRSDSFQHPARFQICSIYNL